MGRILPSFSASFELVSSCNPVSTLLTFISVPWGSSEPARWALTFSGNVTWRYASASNQCVQRNRFDCFLEIYCKRISDV